MTDFSYVDQNLAEIRARIEAASERSGGRDVTLLAAVKYTDTDHINYLQGANKVNAQIFAIESLPMLQELLHAVLANVVHTKAVQIVDVFGIGVFNGSQKSDFATVATCSCRIDACANGSKILVNV